MERHAASQRDVESVLARLRSIPDGMHSSWSGNYFEIDYVANDEWRTRAQKDYNAVIDRGYEQVFRVPTEALAALVQMPSGGWLVTKQTIASTNKALWQIGVFNQLVQQQTDFIANRVGDILSPSTRAVERIALADAAFTLAMMIHRWGVNDSAWYKNLMAEIENNVQLLERYKKVGVLGRIWRLLRHKSLEADLQSV
jgi:hypothetical protein